MLGLDSRPETKGERSKEGGALSFLHGREVGKIFRYKEREKRKSEAWEFIQMGSVVVTVVQDVSGDRSPKSRNRFFRTQLFSLQLDLSKGQRSEKIVFSHVPFSTSQLKNK